MQIRILSAGEPPVAAVATALGVEPALATVLPAVPDACRCAILPVDGDDAAIRTRCHALSDELACDVVALPAPPRPPRLAVFDLDSTLVQCEGIDELAQRAGSGEAVAAVTEAAMRGELDFAQSFVQRVATLAGLDGGALDEIAESMPYSPGIGIMAAALKRRGCRLVIASGGFRPFARAAARRYGFDRGRANELELVDGRLTGRHRGDIVTGEVKAEVLRAAATELGLARDGILAVGDGANDLAMLAEAGLGIAFHAKPIVRERAGVGLNHVWLDGVAWLAGALDPE